MFIKAVLSAFRWLGDQVHRRVQQDSGDLIEMAALRVMDTARKLSPKDTLALMNSIVAAPGVLANGDRTVVINVGVPYGMYQEFGTRHIRPHPYIRPAINELPMLIPGIQVHFNTPMYANPIRATNSGFVVPTNLTQAQREHVRKNLVPASGRLDRGNTSRATFRANRRHR